MSIQGNSELTVQKSEITMEALRLNILFRNCSDIYRDRLIKYAHGFPENSDKEKIVKIFWQSVLLNPAKWYELEEMREKYKDAIQYQGIKLLFKQSETTCLLNIYGYYLDQPERLYPPDDFQSRQDYIRFSDEKPDHDIGGSWLSQQEPFISTLPIELKELVNYWFTGFSNLSRKYLQANYPESWKAIREAMWYRCLHAKAIKQNHENKNIEKRKKIQTYQTACKALLVFGLVFMIGIYCFGSYKQPHQLKNFN